MASAVPLRVHESWALALREFALRLKHRSPSVAKATIRTAGYGTAEEAAEKRLKQVNSAFCATTIQQLTSDFWVKKRPELLLWFIFQQPLKPCPFKACCLLLPEQMNNPAEGPHYACNGVYQPWNSHNSWIQLRNIYRSRRLEHAIDRDRQPEVEEHDHHQRIVAQAIMHRRRNQIADKGREHACNHSGRKAAMLARPRQQANQVDNVSHDEPQPRCQGEKTALHGDLDVIGVEVIDHVIQGEAADIPLLPVIEDRIHSNPEPWMLPDQARSVLPHQHPEMGPGVARTDPIQPPGVVDPQRRDEHQQNQTSECPDSSLLSSQ